MKKLCAFIAAALLVVGCVGSVVKDNPELKAEYYETTYSEDGNFKSVTNTERVYPENDWAVVDYTWANTNGSWAIHKMWFDRMAHVALFWHYVDDADNYICGMAQWSAEDFKIIESGPMESPIAAERSQFVDCELAEDILKEHLEM